MIDIANIPFGHANAIPRPEDRKTDRALRRKIEKANKNGDCIIDTGFGYFRPDPRDEVDVHEFYLYISQNNSKAREILGKNGILVKTFERWLRNGIPVNNTRAAG